MRVLAVLKPELRIGSPRGERIGLRLAASIRPGALFSRQAEVLRADFGYLKAPRCGTSVGSGKHFDHHLTPGFCMPSAVVDVEARKTQPRCRWAR
jgi:hypothetical protein